MISSLRRKRQTTAVPSMPARTAVNWLGVGLLLGAALSPQVGRAQTPIRSVSEAAPAPSLTPRGPTLYDPAGAPAPQPVRTLHFTKPPNVSVPSSLPDWSSGTRGTGNEPAVPALTPSRAEPAL